MDERSMRALNLYADTVKNVVKQRIALVRVENELDIRRAGLLATLLAGNEVPCTEEQYVLTLEAARVTIASELQRTQACCSHYLQDLLACGAHATVWHDIMAFAHASGF